MTYIIAARELSGTSTQVVAQLDDLVVALMALRQALACESEEKVVKSPLRRAFLSNLSRSPSR